MPRRVHDKVPLLLNQQQDFVEVNPSQRRNIVINLRLNGAGRVKKTHGVFASVWNLSPASSSHKIRESRARYREGRFHFVKPLF